MSINGISNPLLTNIGPLSRPDETSRTSVDRGGNRPVAPSTAIAPAVTTLKPQSPIAGNGAAQHAVPAEAPAGTDPTLWSVLTNDERNFFSKTASLGPLTYGRIKSATLPEPPSVRGGRLDVRA